MNIAILGGTFDPPHFGHLLVARQVLEQVPHIDQVLLLPDNTNPFKNVYASAIDRLSMVGLLKEPKIDVSDIDIKRGGETYTIDSIAALQKSPEHTYWWIIGSDLLPQLSRWRDYKNILSSVSFIVFPRSNFAVSDIPPDAIVLPENSLLTTNFSSTAIRKRVSEGRSIFGFVPDRVSDYILSHKLYTKNV